MRQPLPARGSSGEMDGVCLCGQHRGDDALGLLLGK